MYNYVKQIQKCSVWLAGVKNPCDELGRQSGLTLWIASPDIWLSVGGFCFHSEDEIIPWDALVPASALNQFPVFCWWPYISRVFRWWNRMCTKNGEATSALLCPPAASARLCKIWSLFMPWAPRSERDGEQTPAVLNTKRYKYNPEGRDLAHPQIENI